MLLAIVAAGELAWSVAFYGWPAFALGLLGRTVVDPVIARQFPLYLASAAIAYAIAATDPARYRGVAWICIAQRGVELAIGAADWRAHAISTLAFGRLCAIEIAVAAALAITLRGGARTAARAASHAPGDRGLVRLLRAFGGLEVFWFLASTVFVQLGARLLHWPLRDPYTTQQQGVGLLIIGLASLLAASDVARFRPLIVVPVASQLIGAGNALNEIHLGTIGLPAACAQWAIQGAIVGAFAWFSRRHLRSGTLSLAALRR